MIKTGDMRINTDETDFDIRGTAIDFIEKFIDRDLGVNFKNLGLDFVNIDFDFMNICLNIK